MIAPKKTRFMRLIANQLRLIRLPLLLSTLVFLSIFQGCGLFEDTQKAKAPDTKEDTTKKVKEKEKPGELIDTTSVEKTAKDSLDKVYPQVFKDTYDIAIILPAFLEKELREKGSNEKISNVATQFYMGAQLALDTLPSCGKNFEVHVYDNARDTQNLASILEEINNQDIDLIIGPFYTELVKQTAEFAKANKINHLAPLAYVNEQLKNNPYFISIKPGPETFARKAAKIIHSRFQKPNVFLVRSYDSVERKIGFCLDSIIDTSQVASYQRIVLKEEDWNKTEIFRDTLKRKNNYLFIPSENQVFTSSIISNLKALDTLDAHKNYLEVLEDHPFDEEVTILGLVDWLEFETMEGKTMNKFNMHFLSDYYIDYQDRSTKNFVRKYREQFHTEPTEFAFKGYDLTLLGGMMMVNYGKYFERTWYDETTSLLHNDFSFKQLKGQKGWQNFYLRLLRYKDYEVKMIRE